MKKKKLIIQKKIKDPFFSVITVVKNSEKLIKKTITSIQNQNFKNKFNINVYIVDSSTKKKEHNFGNLNYL